MKTYVIYRRVSTQEQGRSGLGLDAQQRDINLYLTNYADSPYEVLGAFTDVLSGKADDRPELANAIALAKKHGAELLVAKLDRLSRKVSFIEPRRVCRRLNCLSYAAMSDLSRAA